MKWVRYSATSDSNLHLWIRGNQQYKLVPTIQGELNKFSYRGRSHNFLALWLLLLNFS